MKPQPVASVQGTPPQSNIPVFSPATQKRQYQQQAHQASPKLVANKKMKNVPVQRSTSSETASSDQKMQQMLSEYQSEIEEIVFWVISQQERLNGYIKEDEVCFAQLHKRYDDHRKTLASTETSTIPILSKTAQKAKYEPIRAVIQTAEYVKQRFENHELFMTEMASYREKIETVFNKGKDLLLSVSSSSGHQRRGSTDSSTDQSSGEGESKSYKIVKTEITNQMKLLEHGFNKLRMTAVDHQKYLHEMLTSAQTIQLEELRSLMTMTEVQISTIIPTRAQQAPTSYEHLMSQIEQFRQLQLTIESEQNLLELTSKLMIVVDDQDASSKSSTSECLFMDQCDALNERWKNACEVVKNRGEYLAHLYSVWTDFLNEESRLKNAWLCKLERRLNEMEDSIEDCDEQLSARNMTRQSASQHAKFMNNMVQRLERMEAEIFYGSEQSAKLHRKHSLQSRKRPESFVNQNKKPVQQASSEPEMSSDDDENISSNTSPLSHITTLAYKLIGLLESSRSSDPDLNRNLGETIMSKLQPIRTRWEVLAGRIEQLKQTVLQQLDVLNNIVSQLSSGANNDSSVNFDRLRQLIEAKRTATATSPKPMATIEPSLISHQVPTPTTVALGEWNQLLDTMNSWLSCSEQCIHQLFISGHVVPMISKNFIVIANKRLASMELEQFTGHSYSNENDDESVSIMDLIGDNSFKPSQLLANCFKLQATGEVNANSAMVIRDISTLENELESLRSIQTEMAHRQKDFEHLMHQGEKIVSDTRNGMITADRPKPSSKFFFFLQEMVKYP